MTVSDLFGLDPNEFVAARDAVVKELKTAGDKDGAEAVKKMRRPSVVVWALDQVARDQPELVEVLIDTSTRARTETERDAFRDALAERRAAMVAVTKAARDVVAVSGRDPDAQERELESAINTIVASPSLTDALQRGELTSLDADDAKLEWPELSASASSQPKPSAPRKPKGPSKELVQARARLEGAQADVAMAEDALEHARAALDVARQQVAQLEHE